MRAKITRRSITALQPEPGRQTWLYDTELRGFMVLCQASGRKSYVVRYKTAGGRWAKMTIGPVAELDPDQARELARDALAASRRGADPARDRRSPTLQQLRDRFMTEHCARVRPGTARNYRILWDRHILPRMGAGLRVLDAQRRHVAQLHDGMRDTPINANRALEVVSKAFDLAEIWGWRDEGTNPCRHVQAFGEAHRQTTLTDDQVARLSAELDRLEHDQAVPMAQLIRLLLLTGCRTGEWRLARWDWLDRDRGVLRVPEVEGVKTAARDVYLPAAAIEILDQLPRSSVYILPGVTGGPIGGHQKIWRRIRSACGLDGVRLHDLRHTVGSLGDRSGMSQRQIADLLGHKQLSTTARYINSADEHKRATADAWGAQIVRLTGGQKKRAAP